MDALIALPKPRSAFAVSSLLLPLLLWVSLLAFAPIPTYLSPQLWFDEAAFSNSVFARFAVAIPVALAALTSLWARRFQWNAALIGASCLVLLSAFSVLHDGTLMALVAASWWLPFFAALWLSSDDRALILQFCLVAFGAQVVATLGAYFLSYQPFITPRFGARAGGMMGSPNQIYPWSLIWGALFWAAAFRAPSVAVKRWLWAGALGSVAVLLLTFSRAGWIGLALVLPFVWPRSPNVKSRINWLSYAVSALLLLGAATIRTRGEILSIENDGSTRGRARLYQTSWRLFQEKPLLGYGVGQIARRDDLGIDFVEPKNIYAQFALEHGVLGLMLFGLFVAGIWTRARRIIADTQADSSAVWASRALVVALPMLLIAGCFDSPIFGHFERIVPTIAFLLLAGLVTAESTLETQKRSETLTRAPQEKSTHSPQEIEAALLQLEAEMASLGVAYFVIGSCARLAYLQELRAVSDIDILIFGARNRRRALPVLELVSGRSGVLVDDSLSRFFEFKNGAYFLVYGRLCVPVEARVFERREVMWHSAILPTFAPQTLLHFFNCLVATPLRAKDKPNVFHFARFVKTRREWSHDLYLPFHFFVARWRFFPLRRLQLGWRRLLFRRLSPPMRIWILKSYQTVPSRLIRGAFNALVPWVFVRLQAHDVKRARPQAKRRGGFTLVEILVVLGIIALLSALIFPVFSQARERGRRTVCTSILTDFGRAFHLYAQDYDGLLPNPGGRGMQKKGDVAAVEPEENAAAWYSPGQVIDTKITDRGALVSYMGKLQSGNNKWACPNAMDAASPYGNPTRAIGQSYTMNDYLRAGHPGAAVIREQDAPAAFNPSYHTGVSLSQVGAGDGHSGADVILLYEAVQRNSGSVNRNGSPYWGRDWLSRYGMGDLPQGAPEEYHQGLSNFLFCDGHVKALRPVATWTSKTQKEVAQFNPAYSKARGGRSGTAITDAWNPRLSDVKYP